MMVASASGISLTLFDFTRLQTLENWKECSNGTSKASFVIQKMSITQRAILFTLLNPKNNDSPGSYAAIKFEDKIFNLNDYRCIVIKCRARGINKKYKILLKHSGESTIVYGQTFTAPDNDFATIKLLLDDFKPYSKGQELSLEEHPFDSSVLSSFSIKIDNGNYLPDNQFGVSALEIDWIKATMVRLSYFCCNYN